MNHVAFVFILLLHYNVAYRQHNYMDDLSNERYYQTQSQRPPLSTFDPQQQMPSNSNVNIDEFPSGAMQQRGPNTNVGLLQNAMQQQQPTLDSDVAPLPNPPIISSTTPFPFTTTAPPAFRRCIQTCSVTSEYNPVCGSNRFTYYNMSRLRCAQYCGLVVDLNNIGRC